MQRFSRPTGWWLRQPVIVFHLVTWCNEATALRAKYFLPVRRRFVCAEHYCCQQQKENILRVSLRAAVFVANGAITSKLIPEKS